MEYLETSSNSHDFDVSYENGKIHFHVLKFDRSCFVWIGQEAILNDLCLAMPSADFTGGANLHTENNSKTVKPVSTKLLGDKADAFDQQLAEKLSRKTDMQIFVSCNLSSNFNDHVGRLVEDRIFLEIKQRPEKFR